MTENTKFTWKTGKIYTFHRDRVWFNCFFTGFLVTGFFGKYGQGEKIFSGSPAAGNFF